MVGFTKKMRSIQIWVLENFQVEVFHYFLPRCHVQRRKGSAFVQKAVFLSASSTPNSPSDRSNPTGTNTIKFMNWLYLEGCGKSHFVRQGRMVSGGVPRGFWQFYICQSLDDFDWWIGWRGGNFRYTITSLIRRGSKDNQYISRHRKRFLILREHQKLTFGSHRWSDNRLRGCYGDLLYRYNDGGQ